MAEKPMSKTQVIATLAEKADVKKTTAATMLEALAAMAYEQASVGFTIPGIGKLVVVDRKARKGRNPQTGESIDIPAKRVLKFRIAKAAKDSAL